MGDVSSIVGIVRFSRSPVESELLLAFSVSEPMESHVHRFGSLGLDFLVDYFFCYRVVGLHRGWRLLVSHFFEDDSDVDGFPCHDIESRQFCFGC